MSSNNIVTIGKYDIDNSFSGYMRSRNVLVKATGLKPNTAFYPFFDGVNVNKFCVPASHVTVKLSTSVGFDSEKLAINANLDPARIITDTNTSLHAEKTSRTCLDHGDVIKSDNTGVTAVIVYASETYAAPGTNTYYQDLYVMNFKNANGKTREPIEGGFVNEELVRSTDGRGVTAVVSGTTTTVNGQTVIINNEGNMSSYVPQDINAYPVYELDAFQSMKEYMKAQKFISDGDGNLQLMFWIPDILENPNYPAFSTGEKTFKLIDSENNSFSSAQTSYTSTGIVNINTNGVSNTLRLNETAGSDITKNDTIISDWSDSSLRTGSDSITNPLAQTFLIKGCEGGCFLTKVDLYFAAIDNSTNSSITLQIREVNNGYPSSSYIKASEVTISAKDVKLSKNKAKYTERVDNVNMSREYCAPDTPTTFEFSDPVYLENGVEYAIVLLSESANYMIWVAELGGNIIKSGAVTNKLISDKPYYGSLFKSQNASAWEIESTQYLLCTIYYANFDKTKRGTITLSTKNASTQTKTLQSDPLESVAGSNKVKVWSTNHGFYGQYSIDKDNPNYLKVRLHSSDYGTSNSGQNKSDELNGFDNVQIFDRDLEVLEWDLESFTVKIGEGNASILADKSGYFGGDNVTCTIRTNFDIIEPNIEVSAFSSNSTAYTLNYTQGGSISNNSNIGSAEQSIKLNENDNNTLTSPAVVDIASKKNISVVVDFSTTNENLSPVFDKDRSSAIIVSNIIDYPDCDSIKTVTLEPNTIADLGILYRVKTIIADRDDVSESQPLIFSYTDADLNDANDNYRRDFAETYFKGGNAIANVRRFGDKVSTVQIPARYIMANAKCTVYCEYAHAAQYVTNAFPLADTSNYLKVLMDVNVPEDAAVEVYYKVARSEQSLSAMESVRRMQWVKFDPTQTIPTAFADEFTEVAFVKDLSSLDESAEFDIFQLKIIMKSRNSSKVPLIKNLRMIACYA